VAGWPPPEKTVPPLDTSIRQRGLKNRKTTSQVGFRGFSTKGRLWGAPQENNNLSGFANILFKIIEYFLI
jgi:hypothetical protein